MVNQLSQLRNDIANSLQAAGLRTTDYIGKLVPPVAAIIPADPYFYPAENGTFGEIAVGMQIVLIGPKTTVERATELFDDMILRAVIALPDYCEVLEVGEPKLRND